MNHINIEQYSNENINESFRSSNHEQCVTLRNGVTMPLIGLGTSHNGGYSHSCVVYALKQCGYRLIDTAKRYGTEEFISYAIKVC
ncbi:hypothetical protein BLA29_008931 [Euroglyphus maynei]|uniref:NADP-dependent oxidoreductase domain-containing protein n=1 Tax=Euroglyphus maynei TaxID=6958 RepID=A0A1Y3ASG7_EURMA|nr:hypothetical protein BLA29_008931 [Euroglyphus maynei]